MISDSAVCIDSTLAWINTSLPYTSQSGDAIWILKAFIGLAVLVCISLVMWQTEALSFVPASLADGIGATCGEKARVLAFSLNAGLIITTLRIPLAAS